MDHQQNKDVYYDAFISYSHAPTDAMMAEALHKKLERYHIPWRISRKSGRKKGLRVFRDKEELALSPDLTDNIYAALRASEFLILLCSPESLRSKWVQREVEYFVQCHGQEKVLTVLVNGEPKDAFPEILCRRQEIKKEINGTVTTMSVTVEPLAADIRGKNKRERLKKLNGEFLRLIAVIAGCRYDDLKQRHREYRMKQVMAGMGIVLLLILFFMVYALRQAALINEQYQNARRNQARYLAKEANDLMDAGDRMGALQASLIITPEDGADGPVVPEQMYALNRALYSYQYSDNFIYGPDVMKTLEGRTTGINSFSSKDKLLFCLDKMGKAYFFELPEYKLIRTAKPDDFAGIEDTVFVNGRFLSDGRILLTTEHYFLILDIKSGSCDAVIESEYSNYEDQPLDVMGNTIAVSYKNDKSVYFYTFEEKAAVRQVLIDVSFEKEITRLRFSPDGSRLAIGEKLADPWSRENSSSLYILTLETGDISGIDSDHISEMRFVDENTLAVIQYEEPENSEYDLMYYDRYYYAAVYDVNTGAALWQNEKQRHTTEYEITGIGIDLIDHFIVNEEAADVVSFYIMNTWVVVNKNSWDVILQRIFEGNIVGVARMTDRNIMIGLENGEVYRSMLATFIQMLSIKNTISNVYYDPETDTVMQITADKYDLVFSRRIKDDSMSCVGSKLPWDEDSEEEKNSLEDTDAVVKENADSTLAAACDDTGIKITDTEKNEILFHIPADNTAGLLFDFMNNNNYLIVYDERGRLTIWDVENKHVISDQRFDIKGLLRDELIVDKNDQYFALNLSESSLLVTDQGIVTRELNIFYLDEEFQIFPYADIPYGDVNFETKEICCRSRQNDEDFYYMRPFYTYQELQEKAEKLSGSLGLTEDQMRKYYLK